MAGGSGVWIRWARLAAARPATSDHLQADVAAIREARRGRTPRRRALAALALAVMVTVSFLPAYQAGFVWDDFVFTNEPMVRSVSGFLRIWTEPGAMKAEGHYWPVTYTTFWLEHKLWGLHPLGYHVVNVLLHLASVLLLWLLLDRLLVRGAWVVAAVFAVHPLHVESVAWIIERKDVLSGLFYLAAFLAYIRSCDRRSRGPYLLAVVLFVAGILSKTVVVTLPAALAIWHWWQRGRIAKNDLMRTAPFFAIGLVFAIADTVFYRTRELLDLDYSLVERVLIAARAFWFYVGKLLWPSDLAVIYPLWQIDARDPVGWTFVALTLALPATLWFGRGRWGRGPLACVAFYAAALSPALGLIDFGYMQFAFVADRFQYLAGIGVMILIVSTLVRSVDRLPAAGVTGAQVLLVAVLASLGTLTWKHARNFQSDLSLFSHIVSLNPAARGAHHNLSLALGKAGRYEESLEAGRIALERDPDSAEIHSTVGLSLMNLGRFEEADAAFDQALEFRPRHLEANRNLAESMRRQGRYDEAVEQYRHALAIDQNYVRAWAGLGDTYYSARRYEHALDAANRALAIDPTDPNAAELHVLLGKASREAGRLQEGERHLLRAIELAPDQANALRELATLYTRMDRLDEVDTVAAQARQLEPYSPATLHAEAETLRRQQRYDEAVALYREVVELDSGSAAAHAGIGLSMFELKRHEEALQSLERALGINPDLPEAPSLHRVTGQALQALGRLEEAAPQFERALELEPRDAVALDHLAFIRVNEGRHDEALVLYRALLDINDANATAHANMGITLFNLGRYAEAVQSLQRSLELDPEQSTARNALAEARRRARAEGP